MAVSIELDHTEIVRALSEYVEKHYNMTCESARISNYRINRGGAGYGEWEKLDTITLSTISKK